MSYFKGFVKVWFQFHTGSIKSFMRDVLPTCVSKFQFHTGSIKSRWGEVRVCREFRFQFHTGSIKRRNDVSLTGAPGSARFQFHTGSIKSALTPPQRQPTQLSFNSILVRLKGVRVFLEAKPISVSIPYWFD